MKYEFKQLKFNTEMGFFSGTTIDDTEITMTLNEHGIDGWDLASTYTIEKVKGGTKFIVCVLKRGIES